MHIYFNMCVLIYICIYICVYIYIYIYIINRNIRLITTESFSKFSSTQLWEPVRRDLLNLAPATFFFPRYTSHRVDRANFNAQHAKRGVAA